MTGILNRTTACRGCGKEIAFIKTEKGKSMPVDPEPVWIRMEAGGNPFMRADGTYVYGHKAGDADDDPDSNLIEAYISHFATCTEPEAFRKRKSSRK